MVNFENVHMTFYSTKDETRVLDSINMHIDKGEIVAIVGPSGSGKTTILNLISGTKKQTSGKITVKGKVGYMFQYDNLLEWYNVLENIKIGLKIQKWDNEELVNRLIKEYGLWEFKNNYPRELSGGMRQRVALIRTLVVNPEILLLDEPFSALDAQTKIIVIEDVLKIVKNEKKTVVFVTHDINEAIKIADRIIVLSNIPAKIKSEYKKEKNPYDFDLIWNDLKNE